MGVMIAGLMVVPSSVPTYARVCYRLAIDGGCGAVLEAWWAYLGLQLRQSSWYLRHNSVPAAGQGRQSWYVRHS